MKHGKKPTVAQCDLIQAHGMDSRDWLVVKDTPNEMVLVHRYSDKTTRTIRKGVNA
jgi:hypothetical protein